MKVHISYGGKNGSILYDVKNQEALISHPDDQLRDRIHRYLNSVNHFTVTANPDPHISGSRTIVSAKPIHSTEIFDLSMNELMANTGAKVHWDKTIGGSKYTPVVKSIDGDDFEIIT